MIFALISAMVSYIVDHEDANNRLAVNADANINATDVAIAFEAT
jgi:hypothetical protein